MYSLFYKHCLKPFFPTYFFTYFSAQRNITKHKSFHCVNKTHILLIT